MLSKLTRSRRVARVTNWLRRQPRVRWFVDEYRLFVKYGLNYPEFIILPNSKTPIYLDRREQRSRQLLLGEAKGQSRLKAIWHCAIAKLKPAVIVDVGANYGEFVFGERYPNASTVLAVEANRHLESWLRKSWEKHPDNAKIQVVIGMASEKSGELRPFFINKYSSGRSSANARSGQKWVAQDSTTFAIDDLVSLDSVTDNIVFKIDVEGFEPNVISGMSRMIRRATGSFGIIEFNSAFIESSGTEPEKFLRSLFEQFQIAALCDNDQYVILEEPSLDSLRSIFGCEEIEADLVLVSRTEDFEIIENAATFRTCRDERQGM